MTSAFRSTEQRSLAEAVERLPAAEADVGNLTAKLAALGALPEGADVLDVGAAQGRFVVAFAKRGYRATGVEPWEQARLVAAELAQDAGLDVTVVAGVAEELPFPDQRFDLVHARSVIEHVRDAQMAFNEAHRVLKPGGAFWFSTASSMCPKQHEISGFPCFGWYPDRLKRRIMAWAKTNKPELIGHTETPAIYWFTPWKARRMLRKAGFSRVYDRWDMPRPVSESALKRLVFGIIGSTAVTKALSDVFRAGCAYTAVKSPAGQAGVP